MCDILAFLAFIALFAALPIGYQSMNGGSPIYFVLSIGLVVFGFGFWGGC